MLVACQPVGNGSADADVKATAARAEPSHAAASPRRARPFIACPPYVRRLKPPLYWSARLHQGPDMRRGRGGERAQIVTALQRRDDAAPGVGLGDLGQRRRHPFVIVLV